MPKILENEALALAQGIESLPPDQQAQAADVLRRYREQQHDLGEPDWPSQEQAAQESEGRFRALFDDLKNVDNQSPSFAQGLRFSTDPDADRARVAGTAFLSRVYQKQPEEVSRMFPLLRDDYLNKRGQKTGLDDRAFYSFAQGEVKRMTAREKAALEGAKAALRGEDSGKALAAWQAANPDFGKEDSGFFSSGFNKAMEEDGDSLPVAANLLSLLESGSFKSKDGKAVSTPFTEEQAAQLGGMVEQLAGMKPRQRKSIYRAMNARIEAAGYDQKGFWASMLSDIDRGLYRASTTLGTQAGILGDVMEAQANASQRSVDFSLDGGGGFSTPVLSVEEQQQLQRQRDYRERVGEVVFDLQNIVSEKLDPFKPSVSWLNDTLEEGLVRGPGAVLPFMAASAALGPWGAGILFTADFAEQNRRDLVGMGMDADQARQIGALAAPAQAAVESLSNMLSLGKFPAVQAFFQRFTKPVAGVSLLGRYAQNTALSLGTELTEELIQDNFVVPFAQELLGSLESDIPQVDWKFYKDRAWNSIPELTAALLPMALVFGGFMSAADAKLSERSTRDIDYLKNVGFDQAQAVDVASQPTANERIKRAASLWSQRKGDKLSMEEAGKRLSAQYRELAEDTAKNLAELEQRGKLPRMLPMQGGGYRVTYNDGSVADFQSYQEASSARWFWFRDQLGKEAALMRQSLESLEKNLERGRELAVEISPEAMPVDEAKKRGIISDAQVQERLQQAAVLDEGVMMGDAITLGKMEGNEEEVQLLLGMSKNEWFDPQGQRIAVGNFKNDVLRTTVKLWDGAGVFTLVEEKTEGDAKLLLSSGKRDWMLERLRAYEQASGDRLFRFEDDDKLNNKDLIEAWSHVAQAYLIVGKEKATGRSFRRYLRNVEEAGLTAAMNAQAIEWQAVVNRAQKLGELKAAGKLNEDVVAELEKQLGIDSQVKHEQGAMQEAQQVRDEVAQQVDTSGYSEANPGPNGETFSIGRVKNGGRLLTFEKPIETPLGRVVSYEWQSELVEDVDKAGEAVLRRVSDWDKAVSNAETGRAIVHHFTVIQPDGSQKTVSLESALKATKGTETGKALNAAVKAARRLPLREAELAELEKLQADYDAAIQEATSQGWRNAPEPELRTPEFPPLAERGVKAVYVGGQFIKNLEPNELGSFGYKPSETEWKKQWAVGQLQRPPYGTGDRIQLLKRLIKKDRVTIDSASLFSSRAIPADASKVVQMPDGARLVGPTTFSIRAYHGTPHKVDKFSLAKIGTGEGAQAYGWGLYFAESRDVGEQYQKQLGSTLFYDERQLAANSPESSAAELLWGNQGDIEESLYYADNYERPNEVRKWIRKMDFAKIRRGGNLYTVELLPDEDDFLDWDKPLSEQSEKVKAAVGEMWQNWINQSPLTLENGASQEQVDAIQNSRGSDFYALLAEDDSAESDQGNIQAASKRLASLGIPGIRYLDGGSRGAGDGTRNYVIFDENLVRILEENGKPVAQETFSLRVTPAQDAEYMAAVEAGDMQTAQRMVDEAAKAAGYNVGPVYHAGKVIDRFDKSKIGTGRGDTNLGRGFYFHEDKDVVEGVYGEEGPVKAFYIKAQNPLDVQSTGGNNRFEQREKDGYDSARRVVVDKNEDTGQVDIVPLGEWVVWNPNQAKSADPVTRDESGNVIPLSQRFNPADDRITYSLRPGDFASRVEAMFSPFQRSPEARLVMARVAKDRALRLGNELIDKANVIRRIADLEREAKTREAFKADELINQGVQEQEARRVAKQQAQDWLATARKEAGSPKSQRERIKAWLRVLDGILAAVPAEVRARVGGYTKMAGIATDEAALRYLENRVEKLNAELEKFLIKDARKELERIFDKSRPKTEAGEKAKGKLTPEAHAWFNLAEQAAKLSPAVADERIEGIEKSLSEEMSAAVKQELSDWLGRPVTDDAEAQEWQEQRLTIFQTFGSVLYGTDSKAARNAAETTAAFELARKVYQDGRLANLEETAKRREKRAADRADGINRVGSPYDPNKANARKKALNKASGLKGRILDYLDTGLDASGFFLDLLGHGDLYETTRRNILEAEMSKDDAMRKRKADFAAMLQKVFPGKSLVARLRGLWELQNIQEGTPVGSMSQLQAVQLTLWWMDLDSREWLESNGYGQAWQAQAESWLTSEACAVRSWLLKQYEDQYNYINPVFRRLRGVNLPRVDVYGGKRQVEHSKSDSSVSLEMDQMRGGMEAGFTKTRVARPSGPPKMTDALQNYWQNAFQVEHYVAFAETITELKAVFGHRDFRLAVETNRGQDKASQVSDIIKNLEQAGTRDAFAHTAQGKLFGRYGKAVSATALLFKLSVIAKQAPAMIQSMFKVGFKEYMTSLGRILSGKGAIALGDMYRSDTVQRRLSDHDGEMAQAAKGWNQRHFENEIIDKAAIAPDLVMNAGWYAIGWTDARFTTVSAAVAYDVAFRNAKSLGMPDDEAKAYAKDEADLIVMETAQPQGVATKSLFENQAPSSLLRLLFAFQSANRQAFGLAWLAAKTSKKDTANALFTAALISAIAQTAGGLMRMLTTDDEPEDIFTPEAYLLGMSTATMTGIPLMGPVFEFVAALGGAEARTAVNPAAAAAKSLSDLFDGKADSKDISTIMNTVGLALGGRGASIGVGWNVLNQLMGLYESATDQ